MRICRGKKVRGERRLRCGEEVDDPRVVEETMRLINEFLSRVEKRRSVLLSDLATPFDYAINALNDWLSRIEAKIGEDGDKDVVKLRMAMFDVGEKMLELLRRAREKWLSTYKQELEELIKKLRRGETEIIITGEPLNNNKSFMVHLYIGHSTIEVARVAKSGNITISISLTGLKGIDVFVPKFLDDKRLRASQYGLLLTDGTTNKKGYPAMGTNRLWQAIIFSLIFPGKSNVSIRGLSLNNDVKVTWNLVAIDHKGLFKSKAKIAWQVLDLDNKEFLVFLLFAVLGDGDICIKKRRIKLNLGNSKHEIWGNIIKKLTSLGFRNKDNEYKRTYTVWSSKAIALTQRVLDDSIIKLMIEDLSKLVDAEKLRRLIILASTKVKPIGNSSVEVVGIRMTVSINNKGLVKLIVGRKDYENAIEIQKRLREAKYNAELKHWGERYVVYLNHSEINKHPELIIKVCEVLKRMLKEAISEGEEKRARSIARAMAKLNCQDPAQGPRA
ncbi:hypothetical protein [Vulcanisaeta sp. JCM 16161]|uniref:hypothetical protein n=1 Tax=Vulcanisaeta sp. JCM 16161 TaxID=1295372 RepID=UPI00406C4779